MFYLSLYPQYSVWSLSSNRWINEWVKDIWSPWLLLKLISSFVPPNAPVFQYLLESLRNSWNLIFRCREHPGCCFVPPVFARWPAIWWNTSRLTVVLEYGSGFLFTDTLYTTVCKELLFSLLWGGAHSHFTDQKTEAPERAACWLHTGDSFSLSHPALQITCHHKEAFPQQPKSLRSERH